MNRKKILQQQQQQQQQLAVAYQTMKSEYTKLIFLQHHDDVTASIASSAAHNNNWQILSTHPDGSEVALLEHPNDPYCPYVRMTSVMPGTMQDVWVSDDHKESLCAFSL